MMKLHRGFFLTKYALHLGVGLALFATVIMIYLLVRAVDHKSLSDQNIGNLLIVNGVIAVVLLLIIFLTTWRLKQRLREGKFGSKLLIKLACIFALVGVLPGLLIYSVSYQFVSRSIESWFDVRLEGALEAGLGLGRSTLDRLSADLSNRVQLGVQNLQMDTDVVMGVKLERLREQMGVDDAQVWTHSGVLVASSGESRFQLNPEKPTPQQMRQLKTQRTISFFEGLDSSNQVARLRVIVAFAEPGTALRVDQLYLVVTEKLPTNLVADAVAIQNAHTEYQERSLVRHGLQQMYIGTLTLSLFLAVLVAFILAVILGNQLIKPLLVLADGVERVSSGDLTPPLVLAEDNELAGLTRSFASMTQQLSDARIAEQKNERVKAWNEVAQRVAHEIKNPLTPIQLSAERLGVKLRDKLQGADLILLEKSVKTIVDQVEAMKHLVNEFRNYARLPNARLKPISLIAVVQDVLSLYEQQVQSGKIRLLIQQAPLPIQGDAEQLRQAMHNLLQNALDAAGSSVSISVGLAHQTLMAFCCVEDDGSGFPARILERAFEPYNTTKPKGTGLGLAVVRKIVQDHHGQITLSNKSDSEDGRGARVMMTFPLIAESGERGL